MVFDTFRQDEKTIRAVEMDFIIIGECAAQILEELKKKAPSYSLGSYAGHAKPSGTRLLWGG